MGGQGLLEWGANLILDMAKLFEATRSLNGTFDVRFHDVKGIQLNSLGANDRDGSLTALDASPALPLTSSLSIRLYLSGHVCRVFVFCCLSLFVGLSPCLSTCTFV